jgi:hypothetical protein
MKSVLLENGYSSEVFKINNNGTVETVLTGELDTICDVTPKSFPFDCQSCYVIMGRINFHYLEIDKIIHLLSNYLKQNLLHSIVLQWTACDKLMTRFSFAYLK